jgi:hypothetical protein
MAVTKTVEIDGKEVTFRASAAIPRLYRNKFHRDIYKDLNELQKGIDENDPESSNLDTFSGAFREHRVAHGKAPESGCPGYSGGLARPVQHLLDLRDPPADHRAVGTECGTAGGPLKKTSSDRAGNDNPALFTPVRADRAFHLGARPAHHRDCQRHVRRNEQRRLSVSLRSRRRSRWIDFNRKEVIAWLTE